MYNELIAKAQQYFPTLQIKYKDRSWLMRLIGKLTFFNPDFMTKFMTTFGTTVYVPNQQYIQDNYASFAEVFIHECVHMHDEKRLGFWYTLGYAFPQILSPFAVLLLFLFSWKIVIPIMLLLLLPPLPAPWRTYFERRSYFVQMYVNKQLYGVNPFVSGPEFASWFKNGNYYWMWPFGQEKQFALEATNISLGIPACSKETELYQMVNDLITAAK